MSIQKGLYFALGFMLPVHFGKLFLNFSPFDAILIILFFIDYKNLYKYVFSKNLGSLFKVNSMTFLILMLFSYVHILQYTSHFKYLFQYTFCIFIALPVFIFSFSSKRMPSVVTGIIVGSFFAFSLVVLIIFEQAPGIVYDVFDVQRTARIRTGLAGVNDYAICLVSALTYLLLGDKKHSLIKLMSIIAILFLVGATGSRVGLILALFIIFVRVGSWSWQFNLITTVIIGCLLLNLSPEKNPVLRIINLGLSDPQRQGMALRAISQLEQNPNGIGLGNHLDPIAGYPVHNFFIINLVEQGLILGLLFLLPVALTFVLSVVLSESAVHRLLILLYFGGFTVVTHTYDRFFWVIPALGLSSALRRTIFDKNCSDLKRINHPSLNRA